MVWEILLGIIGCYAIGAMAAHLIAKRREALREHAHYVLLASDEAEQMEWYLRRLDRWSRRTGNDIRVTVVDLGVDETAAIADRFARESEAVSVVQPAEAAEAAGEEDKAAAVSDSGTAADVESARTRQGSWKRPHSGGSGGADGCLWWKVHPTPGQPGRAVLLDLSNPDDVEQLP